MNLIDRSFAQWLSVSAALHAVTLLLLLVFFPKVIVDFVEPAMASPSAQPREVPFTRITVWFKDRESSGAPGRTAPGPAGDVGRGKPVASPKASSRSSGPGGVLAVFHRSNTSSAFDELIDPTGNGEKMDAAFQRADRFGLPDRAELREGKTIHGTGTGGGSVEGPKLPRYALVPGKGDGPGGSGGIGHSRAETEVHPDTLAIEESFSGHLPREAVLKVIQDHLALVRYCYERRLQLDPDLRGSVVVNFVIGGKGYVIGHRIKKSTLKNEEVELCVDDVVSKLRFPDPQGGTVDVTFPFLFRSAGTP